MKKFLSAFVLATMLTHGAVYAQTSSGPSEANAMSLKQRIAQETENMKSETVAFDPRKMEKISRQAPQKRWTKKSIAIVVGITAVLVGLAIVLAHNTKRCIRREPSGCNFADDINCRCVEFEQ